MGSILIIASKSYLRRSGRPRAGLASPDLASLELLAAGLQLGRIDERDDAFQHHQAAAVQPSAVDLVAEGSIQTNRSLLWAVIEGTGVRLVPSLTAPRVIPWETAGTSLRG